VRILFITRKYPPISGGMEKYSKELYEALSRVADVRLCANRRGNKALPFFLIAAAFRIMAESRRYEVIHFGDGLLAALIPFARAFSRAAVTITVHGLDASYANPLYQATIVPLLRTADRVICISRNTRELCLAKGVPAARIAVVPNGIAAEAAGERSARRPACLPEGLATARMLCTVGRLIKRKGHEWFIRDVMGRLDPSYVYAIAGDGPERARIERAIVERAMKGRVFLLGKIDESEKEWLLRASRLFIMPNVPVPGDVEGFGLVLIEAASRGLMAIASNIDGIPDAVIPGETALLVPPGDPEAFASAIAAASPDRGRVEAAAASFAWDRVIGLYLVEMEKARVEARRPRLPRKHP
jgi:glycosyltransferase involved in cell wall biosynthesis